MKKNSYIILKYEKAKAIQKMLGLSDEQFLKVLNGRGYLTTERVSLGKDILMRVGTYIDEKDAEAKFNLEIPFRTGVSGLYDTIKKRHEYGLNDSENNYFAEKKEAELRKLDEDMPRRLYLIRTYKEYLSSTLHMNLRIRKNLAINELYINNVVNGTNIRDIYKKEPETEMVEEIQMYC